MLAVFDCRFVAEAANVVYVGGVGTGKTRLSIAFGDGVLSARLPGALRDRGRVGHVPRRSAAAGPARPQAPQLARFDVVILDELGYVPLDKVGADLLFGFISQRYERRSLVVTTNLPFARWSEVFLDPTAAAAVIDRIVHHATVLQTSGSSFRLAAAKRNQAPPADEEGTR